MNHFNELTLLEAQLELKALQTRRRRTPEQHREVAAEIIHLGKVISLIEKEARQKVKGHE